MYKWTDNTGTMHFTDDLSKVPDEIRQNIQNRENSRSQEPIIGKDLRQSETINKSNYKDSTVTDAFSKKTQTSSEPLVKKDGLLSNDNKQLNYEDSYKAAYFGEIETLKKMIGPKNNIYDPEVKLVDRIPILNSALHGKQYEVIKLVIQCGFPKEWDKDYEMRVVFQNPDVDMTVAKMFVELVPDFRTKFGPVALMHLIQAKQYELVRYLLEQGVSPNDKNWLSLSVAMMSRDEKMIPMLLKYGADPYLKSNGTSPVEIAIKLRSADLLALLDTQKRYADKAAQLSANKPPQNLPFIGTWAYQPPSGGFGSVAMTLFKDGTALMGTDIGALPTVWEYNNNKIQIFPLDERGNISKKSLEGQFNDSFTTLQPVGGANNTVLRKIDLKQVQSERDTPKHPRYIRIQKACITSSGILYLQVNNRHIKVPIPQLVNGAQKSDYGMDRVKENIISWSDFSRDPIPETILKQSREVPFVKKLASAKYSNGWNKVGWNHDTLATVTKGFDYTLFPSDSVNEELTLLANKPFTHGKDWVMIFFQKSKDR